MQFTYVNESIQMDFIKEDVMVEAYGSAFAKTAVNAAGKVLKIVWDAIMKALSAAIKAVKNIYNKWTQKVKKEPGFDTEYGVNVDGMDTTFAVSAQAVAFSNDPIDHLSYWIDEAANIRKDADFKSLDLEKAKKGLLSIKQGPLQNYTEFYSPNNYPVKELVYKIMGDPSHATIADQLKAITDYLAKCENTVKTYAKKTIAGFDMLSIDVDKLKEKYPNEQDLTAFSELDNKVVLAIRNLGQDMVAVFNGLTKYVGVLSSKRATYL